MILQKSSSMFVRGLLLLLPFLWPSFASGQEVGEVFSRFDAPWLSWQDVGEPRGHEDHLETDRDSFTPSTSTVGAGRVVFESAYSFIENRSSDNAHSFPEILTRIGLGERAELRLGWNYEVGGGGSVSSGHSGGRLEQVGSEEESRLLYGFKVVVTEQDSWIPNSACIVQGTTPTSGAETASDLQLGYVFGWEFPDEWQLDSSLRYVATAEEGDRFNHWAPSVVLKVPVGDRWNVHGEYFGIFTNGRAENQSPQYFSPGVHYLFSPDLEVGVRVGWGLNQDAANSFINAGFGVRF